MQDDIDPKEHPEGFLLSGEVPEAAPEQPAPAAETAPAPGAGDIVVLIEDDEGPAATGKKRGAEEPCEPGGGPKRARAEEDDIVLID